MKKFRVKIWFVYIGSILRTLSLSLTVESPLTIFKSTENRYEAHSETMGRHVQAPHLLKAFRVDYTPSHVLPLFVAFEWQRDGVKPGRENAYISTNKKRPFQIHSTPHKFGIDSAKISRKEQLVWLMSPPSASDLALDGLLFAQPFAVFALAKKPSLSGNGKNTEFPGVYIWENALSVHAACTFGGQGGCSGFSNRWTHLDVVNQTDGLI